MALPGVQTVLKDRFFTLSRTDAPSGTRVATIARRGARDETTGKLLTGSTSAGNLYDDDTLPPDYTAYRPRNEQEVIDAFGEHSELHRSYLELVAGGAARIDLIPIPTKNKDTGASINDDLDLEDTSDGNPLEKSFSAVEAAQADIVVPWGRGSHPLEWQNPATPGDDPPDVGFYADNDTTAALSFAKRVADHCKEISERSRPIFGVIGVKPFVGDSGKDGDIPPSELETHLGFPDLIDRELDMGDSGQYVSVVATELVPTGYPVDNNQSTYGFANGASTYAGYLAGLNSEIAATGKTLFNVRGLRYAPTRPEQEDLVAKGLVPIALNYRRQAKVVDAQTFAKETSDYIRLSTVRIVFDAVQIVRNVAESYVGLPATLEHRAALETAISSRLRGMTVTGVLQNSDVEITYLPRENKAYIDLTLQPAFEMRNIDVSISVQL